MKYKLAPAPSRSRLRSLLIAVAGRRDDALQAHVRGNISVELDVMSGVADQHAELGPLLPTTARDHFQRGLVIQRGPRSVTGLERSLKSGDNIGFGRLPLCWIRLALAG